MITITADEVKLVEENHNLIYKFCYRHKLDANDYYDILAIGLCKSAMGYSDLKGKFSTFAWTCMLNEVRMYKRRENVRITDYLSLNSVISYDDFKGELTIEDTIPSDICVEDDVLHSIMSSDFINSISKLDKDIVHLRLLGFSQSEISSKLKISQSYISRRLINLKKKLKGEQYYEI